MCFYICFKYPNDHGFNYFQGNDKQENAGNCGFGTELCQLQPPTSQRAAGRTQQLSRVVSKQHKVSTYFKQLKLD